METKMFEIRDRMTFIAVVAVLMRPTLPVLGHKGSESIPDSVKHDIERFRAESYLLRRCGYAIDDGAPRLVALGRADADGHGQFCYDPYSWRGQARTIPQAHVYITEHWDELRSGDVIDVEFILGETTEPKISEYHS